MQQAHSAQAFQSIHGPLSAAPCDRSNSANWNANSVPIPTGQDWMVLRRYEIALAHLSAALDINMSPHGIQISLLHLLRWYCNSKWKRNYTTQPDLALTLFANHDGRHIGAGY